jgi:hypothetical protein
MTKPNGVLLLLFSNYPKLIALSFIVCFISSCNSPLENVIERNKKLEGTLLDDVTRFDSVHIDSDKSLFTYHYTILQSSLDTSSEGYLFTCRLFQKQMEERLKGQVNLTNEEFRVLHESGFGIKFGYQDLQTNQPIGQVVFSNSMNGYNLMREEDEWTDVVDMAYDKLINPDSQ